MRLYKGLTTVVDNSLFAVALTTFIVTQTPCLAAGSSTTAAPPKANAFQVAIGQIEDKLYEHEYRSETDDARLARIEKFVFGAVQTGTTAERVQRVQATFASESSAIDKVTPSTNQAPKPAASAPATPAVTSTPAFDSANYPRVTELEQDMLNATYVHEPLQQRLSRLEVKAFGAASRSTDLCARVDDLDEYAETHKIFKNHKDPLNSSNVASTSRPGIFSNSILSGRGFPGMSDSSDDGDNSDDAAPPKAPVNPFAEGITGTDRKLSAMEEFVYGHNYATRPVQDRLERLEKRLVPYEHNLAQKDVTYRVNNIWNILSVANTFNTAPTAAHPANTAAVAPSPSSAPGPVSANQGVSAPTQSTLAQASKAHHSWLHQLGNSLGSASVTNGTSAPGAYPPDMGPKPGHVYVP